MRQMLFTTLFPHRAAHVAEISKDYM